MACQGKGEDGGIFLLRVDNLTAVRYNKLNLYMVQTNHEGVLVDEIQQTYRKYQGIVINPGAYTHTSIAILDAVKAVGVPTVEVHISDVSKREDFRQISYIRAACIATIAGHGIDGYLEAMDLLIEHCEAKK